MIDKPWRPTRIFAGLTAIGLTLLLAGPGWPQTPEPAPLTARAQEVLRQLKEEAPGLWELRVDERLGIVVLSGVAGDLPTKRQGLAAARAVPGVLEVLDLLEVRTRPRPDADIDRELLSQLEQKGPQVGGVTVRTDEGVVELTGRVESLALRSEVDDLAAGVAGVRDVVNHLTVDRWAELPQQQLPEEIVWALPFDSSTVTMVRQGDTVILRGMLLSREQVDGLVQAMMRQPGVVRVISELKVKNPFEKLRGLSDPR